ncbi:NAD(P)H-hydrate epimerase [Pedobacter sp.]|uniref:NAD(P)H-hydrate epimerase n=1 Tax=Pedobacter sp. TaxID=1411316 RepID=UPI003D7F970D
MQTLLSSEQMRMADEFTIAEQKIASVDLMERAAEAFIRAFIPYEPNCQTRISVFCGKGNNGGDGLAIARLLYYRGYPNLQVFIADFSAKESNDFTENYKRLLETGVEIKHLTEAEQALHLQTDVVIDAMLGSGLNQPLSGKFLSLVALMNALGKRTYSVDVPTGFFADGATPLTYDGIQAYLTISFQRPKPNFFFPESAKATERFEVVDIGLDEAFIERQQGEFQLITVDDIKTLLKPRKSFSHKGTYGHALLIAGDTNTMGAAI